MSYYSRANTLILIYLNNIIKHCSWIQHFFISSDKMTGNGLQFLKDIPLKSVDFSHCSLLTDTALEYLKGMPLQSIKGNTTAKSFSLELRSDNGRSCR